MAGDRSILISSAILVTIVASVSVTRAQESVKDADINEATTLMPTIVLEEDTNNSNPTSNLTDVRNTTVRYDPINPTNSNATITVTPVNMTKTRNSTRRMKPDGPEVDETVTLEPEDSEEYEEEGDEDPDEKFTSKPSEITLEHIDFVQIRLKHIALSSPDGIEELRALMKEEFKENEVYKKEWNRAVEYYGDEQKSDLVDAVGNNTFLSLEVPEEYHIALTAYTMQGDPALYADFNKKTREVCGGKDVEGYHYKSFFKLLLLAVKTLGGKKEFRSGNRFVYRGVNSPFKLEENQILAFQHFVSTSTSLKIAEEFAGKTLFEMEGPFDGTTMSIRHHSFFRGEGEVLFSPLQVFKVDSVHVGKIYTRYVLKHQGFQTDGLSCGFEPGILGAKSSKSSQGSRTDNQLLIVLLMTTILMLMLRY